MPNTDTQGRPRAWYQPLIIAGLILVIALQLALLLRSPPQAPPAYPPCADLIPAQVEDAWLVQLTLEEGASWIAVLTLLTEIDAQLVAGPSPLGVVRIAIARTGGPYTRAIDALEWLRWQPIVARARLEPGQLTHAETPSSADPEDRQIDSGKTDAGKEEATP